MTLLGRPASEGFRLLEEVSIDAIICRTKNPYLHLGDKVTNIFYSFVLLFYNFFINFAAESYFNRMKTNHYAHLLALITASWVMMLLSCDRQQIAELKGNRADSLIFAAGSARDYDRMMALTDSFEVTGDISVADANRWRGSYYYHHDMFRMAEICYRKVLECDIKTEQDQLSYNKSVRRLSELLLIKGDYEGALKIAIPAFAQMEKTGVGSDLDYAILLNNIGCCQLNLGRYQEADKSFMTARDHYAVRWQTDSTSRSFQEAIQGTIYTCSAYLNMHRYKESTYWIEHLKMLIDLYSEKPDAQVNHLDEFIGRYEMMRAIALQGQNKPKEAQEAFKRFKKTEFSKTDDGRISANNYLVKAKRFNEAADNYRSLDSMLLSWGKGPSLNNIQLYLLPKYWANTRAGRTDSANVVADKIFQVLDHAITEQKNSSMAELATIYNTNEKEAEIARQRQNISRIQFISLLASLGLIVIFLLIYMMVKHKAAQHLEEAHAKLEDAHAQLQTAYDQLETTTKAKERIESELRIARDIQNSMVPHVFQHRDDLDMFASMTPAKEVGGDLYDYLLQDDTLYFCVGDVSGKGVPASLFMAQAIRLFRTLATQRLMPAEIIAYLNRALTENNEQGMFITMFLGLIDLKSGRLDFCNAGHNPPVCGVQGNYQFMSMEPNVPIGLWQDVDFVGEHADNIKGKMLLLYTDGLNEAENQQQQQFGEEHLLDILNHSDFHGAEEVITLLDGEIVKHRNGAEPNDDLTMLSIYFK